MTRICILLLALIAISWSIGCSHATESPLMLLAPDNTPQQAAIAPTGSASGESSDGWRIPLALYAFTADPDAGTLDVEVMRTAEKHMNGVVILEGGPEPLLTLAGPPKFSNGGKQLDVDIKITHPEDDPLLTVFDVHGILLSRGSMGSWSGGDVFIPGPEKTRLMNSDGFTRWWNPKDFKKPGLYGYTPGAMGTGLPGFEAATINGYKTFGDGLSPTSDLSDLDPALRGMFSVGSSCTRHYTLSLKGGLKFNYAVDASWAFPNKIPPLPPVDFPPGANMPEPYWIEIDEWVNTLWYIPATGAHGGKALYHITAHDWQGPDSIGPVKIEIPGIGVVADVTDILEQGPDFIEYDFKLIKPELESASDLELLVTVDSLAGSYQPALTGVDKPLRSYNMHTIHVSPVYPGNNHAPISIMKATTPIEIDVNHSVTFIDDGSYDSDGYITGYKWDFNGDLIYGDSWSSGTEQNPTKIFTVKGEHKVRLRVEDDEHGMGDSEPVTVIVSGLPPVAGAEMVDDPPYYQYYNYKLSGASSSDPDGPIVKYEWDIDYDGLTFNPTLYGESVKATWDAEGEYDIMLRVEDDDGMPDFLDEPLHISVVFNDNHPPVVDEISVSRTTCYRGSDTEKVAINIIAHDPDPGDSFEYKWTCEGGVFDDDTIPNPVWKSPNQVGKFYLVCTLTDNHGAWEEGIAPKIRVTNYAILQPAPAPDFESERLVGTGTFKLSDYTPGRVIMMNFWATW